MNAFEDYSFLSYLAASIAYLLLLPLSIFSLKKSNLALPIMIATGLSFVWAGYTTLALKIDTIYTPETLPFETLRSAGWLLLLSFIIYQQQNHEHLSFLKGSKLAQSLILIVTLTFLIESHSPWLTLVNFYLGTDFRLFAHVGFAIAGLILIEQVYRNALFEQRWAIKFLCLALGSLFVIDFFLYSKSLLFSNIDSALRDSRGIINAIVAPLLAISIVRLQEHTTSLTVSRKLVFHTTVLFATGIYLILMSVVGYYIRDYGGNWGQLAQIAFIFLSILLLIILFVSGRTRALVKVYFNKHFFQYSYDYREEWIKLSKTIAQMDSITELYGLILKTMANLVESSGGGLWIKNEQGDFYFAEHYNMGFEPEILFKKDTPFIRFIQSKQWVIDFAEYALAPDVYEDVDLSAWDNKEHSIWLLVPLLRLNSVEAFVVLTQARAPRILNWEDHDLLKTVGMQLTNALALNRTIDELARSKQFEAYNRLSAFIVHDLKNQVAQIALIVKNAEKHKRNPEFIDDSIDTLKNVAEKMQHVIDQLRKGNIHSETRTLIDLNDIVQDVAIQQSCNNPGLQIINEMSDSSIRVIGEQAKMIAVLGHLVQNAQEATPQNGVVKLELFNDNTDVIIKIIDNGIGMDKQFIATRLFKPFDTTKGNAGMGIGVYEAKDYVTKLSGSIDVESNPGVGSVFTIKLPIYKSAEH
ncbi:XrtA/PEP-CTERM system histidine kinase PrsK [Methylicorpusculum sp.]|uniref:XrtA/PEP-CTERM system histidine kinase PrsK n=1 Tax=Methylicorpusculum sp. TaxID=2713644 RepID=UPI00271B4169|nr:XrtA/PEP-CTERM system histidine kinase PrsK [Methylicorpusculum sp.]MDO8845999.1 PEP-CTERM system histidine kinase PrsK [Methylicorpusculum sp.]